MFSGDFYLLSMFSSFGLSPQLFIVMAWMLFIEFTKPIIFFIFFLASFSPISFKTWSVLLLTQLVKSSLLINSVSNDFCFKHSQDLSAAFSSKVCPKTGTTKSVNKRMKIFFTGNFIWLKVQIYDNNKSDWFRFEILSSKPIFAISLKFKNALKNYRS